MQLEFTGEELFLVYVLVLCIYSECFDAVDHIRCVVMQFSHQFHRIFNDSLPQFLIFFMIEAIPYQFIDIILYNLLLFLLILPYFTIYLILHLHIIDYLRK